MSHNRATAFTLVESLIAAVVLAVTVGALAVALGAGHMHGRYAAQTQQAMNLAEELMEYIATLPYYDPQGTSSEGPEAGEVGLAGLDNADDFDGWSEPVGGLCETTGALYPAGLQHFSRSVRARYVAQSVAALGGSISGLEVTVTVADTTGQTWSITRFVPAPAD